MPTPPRPDPSRRRTAFVLAAVVAIANLPLAARAVTPSALLDGYRQAAGAAPAPRAGSSSSRRGTAASGVALHATAPCPRPRAGTRPPASRSRRWHRPFNAERFTDAAKSEKWFRRNCNDVVGRECTAAEKADVLAWLLTLEP